MTIGERIKYVRENIGEKKMSMETFGKEINVSSASINQWEKGKSEPPMSILQLITSHFKINGTWLLTGEGDMKEPLSRQQEIAELAAKLYGSDENSIEYRTMMYLKDMPLEDWEAFERFLNGVVKNFDA